MVPSFIVPQKQIVATCNSIKALSYWPSSYGDEDTTWAGGSSPRYNQWELTMGISSPQLHGYPYSTTPFQYNGLDINMGGFIIKSSRGMVYRVKEVVSKTTDKVVIIVEDVYRINDFSTPSVISINPSVEQYLYFEVNDNFKAEINGNEVSGLIAGPILQYINTYLEKISFTRYPILCCDETMGIGDVVSVVDGKFVRATLSSFDKVVGKVELLTGEEHEYVIRPVNEYKSIPTNIGAVGDVLYLSDDGNELSTTPTRKPMYLKVMDGIPNISRSTLVDSPVIPAGSSIEINDHAFEFINETTLAEFIDIFNARDIPNMEAEASLSPFTITNDSNYEFGIMGIMDLPCVITINGHEATITTVTQGQQQYGMDVAVGQDIVADLTAANIPNILVSFSTSTGRLSITNELGGDIVFENISGGIFASDSGTSGTGFKESYTAPSGNIIVKLTHHLGKSIIVRDKGIGDFTERSGITSSDNGVLPRGIYYGASVRYGNNYVLDHIDNIGSINPFIGDGVHVQDSGNGEWVEMKFTATGWVVIATEDSARTDADTLSVILDHTYQGEIYLGTVSPNSRISSISVVVEEPFDDDSITLNVGDNENSSRLFSDDYLDLGSTSTYTNSSSHIYQTETDLSVFVGTHNSTTGKLRIIVSYQ